MMELSKRIEELLEKHDFSVCGEITERTYNNDGCDVELETYSPEGEDVIISLIYDGTEEDFIRQFRSYAEGFDAEEHAEMWIESRGKNGVPDSIKDLLEDAEWIKSTLEEVADDLENIDNQEEDTEEINREELAEKFINAIKEIASKPDNLDNLECYLSYHFDVWMEKFAYNPECLVSELKHFAEMKI